MRKLLLLFTVLALVFTLAIGCSSPAGEEKSEGLSIEDLKDGKYVAEDSDFDETGWKNIVTLEVKDGKITDALWNASHKDGGEDKVSQSKSGEYNMVEHGNAIAQWHEQSALVEDYLIETQNPSDIKYSDEGTTDAISGATIKVKEFFQLAQKALESDPQ